VKKIIVSSDFCAPLWVHRIITTPEHTLNEPKSPVRHKAKRRRIKTVMQEMMYKAARVIKHARSWLLGLGAGDGAFEVFKQHYGQMSSA